MRWVVVTMAALLVGLLAYGVAAQERRTGTSSIDSALAQGGDGAAPALDLPRLGAPGRETLEDYRGQVVLVNFWASWCKPCVEEMPELQELQGEMERANGTVLGIASRDNDVKAQEFLERFDVTYPNLRDGSGDTAEDWGVYRQPESFLIDREGRIVDHAIGAIDRAWIEENVIPLLDDA